MQRHVPWGRLMSTVAGRAASDLLPRPPPTQQLSTGGVSYLGLHHLLPSDIFNEYSFGRSPECDIQAVKPTTVDDKHEIARQDWAYGMISNQHCRLYCCLDETSNNMQVFVEDSSGNGTLVNQTILLRRGEKRILHSGDEICLVNPETLEKKVRSSTALRELLQRHSFVFVNVQQQQRPSLLPSLFSSGQFSSGKCKAAVNPRETRQHSFPIPAGRAVQHSISSLQHRVSPIHRRVEEDYDIRDLLGSGTVGQVRRAIHRQTGQERAVKIIKSRGLVQQDPLELEAEATILRELQHPYIVQLADVYTSSKDSTVYIVMELLHGGDLFDRIVAKEHYSEVESRRVMRRLLSAIHYLHEDCNIVHRDLKPENILLSCRSGCIDVKLTDFGLAKSVNGDDLKTFCGTPQYFAPEVLKRRSTVAGRGRYGKPADMWSLGVVVSIVTESKYGVLPTLFSISNTRLPILAFRALVGYAAV
jgi:hypothetical protein